MYQNLEGSAPSVSSWPPEQSEPCDSCDAVRILEEGNRRFSEWAARSMQGGEGGPTEEFKALTGLSPSDSLSPHHPFAAVVGCSDARFPVRLALGQWANRIFEVRVAGNVLAPECVGSIDYAVQHLPSLKTVVVLGHTHCGAVTAAVDAYLQPYEMQLPDVTPGVRSIVQRLLGPVHQAACALRACSGEMELDRTQLIETATYVHAAGAAAELRAEVALLGRDDVRVAFGVFDLRDHMIRSVGLSGGLELATGFSPAPALVEELSDLAIRAAKSIVQHQQTA